MRKDRIMTITEFLLARIAEDEAAAREALSDRPWADRIWPPEVHDDGVRNVAVAYSPPRVLAECAAKRAIVAAAEEMTGPPPMAYADYVRAVRILRALATVHADHPDYRQEWKP